MSDVDWDQESSRCLGVHFVGDSLFETDGRGRRLIDDNLLLLINAHHEDIAFNAAGIRWVSLLGCIA